VFGWERLWLRFLATVVSTHTAAKANKVLSFYFCLEGGFYFKFVFTHNVFQVNTAAKSV